MKDSELISGEFFEIEIPNDKKYLIKYFDTEIQKIFLKYYIVFGSIKNFSEHTGRICSRSLLIRLRDRYLNLNKIYEEAKKSLTEEGLETVFLIESGKFLLTRLNKK